MLKEFFFSIRASGEIGWAVGRDAQRKENRNEVDYLSTRSSISIKGHRSYM